MSETLSDFEYEAKYFRYDTKVISTRKVKKAIKEAQEKLKDSSICMCAVHPGSKICSICKGVDKVFLEVFGEKLIVTDKGRSRPSDVLTGNEKREKLVK